MQKKYLRTAAFAKLAGVNKKTLHYYDEIGLFRPAYVNEKGYRFYSPLQLDRLALIVTLKDLGVPLKVIAEYLTCGDLARVDEILTRQSQELDRRINQLTRRKALLEALRRQNRGFLDWCGKGPRRLHREPERIAVLMSREEMESSRILIACAGKGRSASSTRNGRTGRFWCPAGTISACMSSCRGTACGSGWSAAGSSCRTMPPPAAGSWMRASSWNLGTLPSTAAARRTPSRAASECE